MDEVSRRHETPAELEIQAMILVDKDGNEEKRDLFRYQRKGDDGNFKYLVAFHSPAGIKGVALLTWEHKDSDDDQWIYMPAYGDQLKRVAKGGRKNYFMGTDYAYEDLMAESRDKYQYNRLGEEKCEGGDCFLIDAVPDNADILKSTGYSHRKMWVRKDIFFVVQIEYFDKRGEFIKRQTNSGLKQIEKERWRSNNAVMDNVQNRHKTMVTVVERSFDAAKVPEENFTERFIASGKHVR